VPLLRQPIALRERPPPAIVALRIVLISLSTIFVAAFLFAMIVVAVTD
jgi:hypothetical protein